MKKKSIAHVVGGLRLQNGGPSRSVTQLVDAIAHLAEFDVSLIYSNHKDYKNILPDNDAIKLLGIKRAFNVFEGISYFHFKNQLKTYREIIKPDVLHSHGLWHPVNHLATQCARDLDIPLIIHPRGMLEPWAIQHKAWKKRLALGLYQQRDLDMAKVLVATAEQEYANLRMLRLRQPIAIIPNGVPLPDADAVRVRPPRPPGAPRSLLFLSRVQGKKGLLNLIDAWAKLRPIGWRLLIAGPDEAGHLAEVQARARLEGVSDAVDYVGEVDGAAKIALYQSADLFVLPTFSENFGLVVAEALAHGLPVITTQGAPWADLPMHGCGWWIPIGVEPLADALREAMALSDSERAAMGERGFAYVRRYDWAAIAEDMAAVYRWVLGRGGRPDCVRLD